MHPRTTYLKRQMKIVGTICLALGLALSFSFPRAYAQPVSQDYIPPDVTLPAPGAPDTTPGSTSGAGTQAPGGGTFFTPTGYPFTGGASGQQAPPGQPAEPPLTGASAWFRRKNPGAAGAAGTSPGLSPGLSPGAPGQMPGGPGQPNAGAAMATSSAGGDLAARKDPIAIIQTSKGPIVIRLFRKYAPLTVAHFIQIAQTGFYNGLTFHRVEPGQLIQGGCPNGNGSGFFTDPVSKQPKFIGLETIPNLKHNAAGVVGLARVGRSTMSASSQFYITLAPQPRFDGQYAIFGGVVAGMDVVNQIQKGDQIVSISVEEQ
jgi:peptidyl-prolyl cis-trans isomerase B (cyclophilin B)